MSKIVILLALPVSAAQRIALARLTGQSLMDVSRSITSGEPLVTRKLFMNDHPEVTALLMALIAMPLNLRFFELLEDAAWKTPGGHENQEITRETLRNLLQHSGNPA